MKILLVFRGGYTKIDPTLLSKNIHDKVFNPLKENGIEYSTVFYTYPHDLDKLNTLREQLSPIQVQYTNEGQIINFKEAVRDISLRYSEYEYIVFLRFEIVYKIHILQWNIFGQSGVIFPFKENCFTLFNATNQYSDIIIGISKEYLQQFWTVLDTADSSEYTNTNTLHNLATIIQRHDYDLPIKCMFEGFYQSNTSLERGDERLNPMFIMLHYRYCGSDIEEFNKYLPIDQHTYPVSYQPVYAPVFQTAKMLI